MVTRCRQLRRRLAERVRELAHKMTPFSKGWNLESETTMSHYAVWGRDLYRSIREVLLVDGTLNSIMTIAERRGNGRIRFIHARDLFDAWQAAIAG